MAKSFFRLLIALLGVLSFVAVIKAQESTVRGTVKDASGEVMIGLSAGVTFQQISGQPRNYRLSVSEGTDPST